MVQEGTKLLGVLQASTVQGTATEPLQGPIRHQSTGNRVLGAR